MKNLKTKTRTREDIIRSRIIKLFNVNTYDCILAVVIVGIISRALMLVIYFASMYWIEYDAKIGIWGLLAKGFWICADIALVRTWREKIRPSITRGRVGIVSRRAIMIARAFALLLSGYAFYQAIFLCHLKMFFMINKGMVMGGIGGLIILFTYRTLRVMQLLDGAIDDYLKYDLFKR